MSYKTLNAILLSSTHVLKWLECGMRGLSLYSHLRHRRRFDLRRGRGRMLTCGTASLDSLYAGGCAALAPTLVLRWEASAARNLLRMRVDVGHPPADLLWLGIGVSDTGGMRGADYAVMQRDDEDAASYSITDMYSADYTTPVPDLLQNTTLTLMTSSDNTTSFEVSRPLHSCDDSDVSVWQGVISKVVWAYDITSSSSGSSQSLFKYHGPANRGHKALILWPDHAQEKEDAKPTPPPTNVFTKEILMPNATISKAIDSWFCTHFELPSDKKYHYIKQETLAKSPMLHHIAILSCETRAASASPGDLYECGMETAECSDYFSGWSVGLPDTDLVADGIPAGFPIGQNGRSFFVMQMHYHNPTGKEGVIDDSGVRMHFTDQLRPHDIGFLNLGTFLTNLPLQNPNHHAFRSHCPSECTSSFTSDVTLTIGPFLHMHGLGVNMTVQHFRDGRELAPLATIKHYDFSQASFTYYPTKKVTLKPGDSLTTTCTYAPSKGKNDRETSTEMCQVYVLHYPLQRNFYCHDVEPGRVAVCARSGEYFASRPLETDGFVGRLLEHGYAVNFTEPRPAVPYAQKCEAIDYRTIDVDATRPASSTTSAKEETTTIVVTLITISLCFVAILTMFIIRRQVALKKATDAKSFDPDEEDYELDETFDDDDDDDDGDDTTWSPEHDAMLDAFLDDNN